MSIDSVTVTHDTGDRESYLPARRSDMSGYTKLFSSIVHSTIWREDADTKVLWVTMLALADQFGEVMASVPGLADVARINIDKCEEALNKFMSPDTYSRNPENEGRRIRKIPGGWEILNYSLYREMQSDAHKREMAAERQRRKRGKDVTPVTLPVTPRHAMSLQAEVEADTNTKAKATKKKKKEKAEPSGSTPPPLLEIEDDYDEPAPVKAAPAKTVPKAKEPEPTKIVDNRTHEEILLGSKENETPTWLGFWKLYTIFGASKVQKIRAAATVYMEELQKPGVTIESIQEHAEVLAKSTDKPCFYPSLMNWFAEGSHLTPLPEKPYDPISRLLGRKRAD